MGEAHVSGGAESPLVLPDPQPLVPRPEDVRHFAHERRAGIAEVSPGGRARLDTIARWAQDVAWADAEDAGLHELTLWLVRRTRIRVRRFPRLNEMHQVCTYVTGLGRMWAERRTDITPVGAGEPDVEIACIWVHLDPERLLPTAVHQIEIETWTGPSTRPVKARLRHPGPAPGARSEPWAFRTSELDIADHVNNTAYLTPFDDELIALEAPGGAGAPSADLEIEYRTPAQAGAVGVRAAGAMRWLLGPEDELHASVALLEWPGLPGLSREGDGRQAS